MEFLIELIFELIFEGGVEMSKSKKVPKCIRYFLIAIIVLIFMIIILGMFLLGILMLNENILFGLAFIILSFVFLILSIKKFKETYLLKKN